VGESVSALCLRLAVRVASPASQLPIQCPLRLFPSPAHPQTPFTLHTFKCTSTRLPVPLHLHRRRPRRPGRRRRRSTPSGHIPVTHIQRVSRAVSNRSSSHFCSYNRVDDVSSNVLTHVRRVRRCQKHPPKIPRYAHPSQSPVPFCVLTPPVLRSAEDRKGR
jgi:hypothetical protein